MNEYEKKQLIEEANLLEEQACVNDAYRLAMEGTSKRTGRRLGHLNAPLAYANHGMAAANKRIRAAKLRAMVI